MKPKPLKKNRRAAHSQPHKKRPIKTEDGQSLSVATECRVDQGLVEVAIKMPLDELETELSTQASDVKPRAKSPHKPQIDPPRKTPDRPSFDPVPKAKMVMPGTKAAAGLAAQVRVMDLEQKLPNTTVSALKLVRIHLKQEEVDELEAVLTGRLDDRDLGSASQSPKRALERLMHHDQFQALEIENQACLLRASAEQAASLETKAAALMLCDTKIFMQINTRTQAELCALFERFSVPLRQSLAVAASRTLYDQSILLNQDFRDTTALSHIFELSRKSTIPKPIESAGFTIDKILQIALERIAKPGHIYAELGGRGPISCIEFALSLFSPSEMMRYWLQLIEPDMQVALPSDEYLQLHRLVRFDEIMGPMGALLEQLLSLAHPRGTPTHEGFLMPGSHCLDADVVTRSLGFVYALKFRVIADQARGLAHLCEAKSNRPSVPPVFLTCIIDEHERIFIFDHIEDDEVFIRAAHGGSTKSKGGRRIAPDRLIEDADLGLDRMPLESLKECMGVVITAG